MARRSKIWRVARNLRAGLRLRESQSGTHDRQTPEQLAAVVWEYVEDYVKRLPDGRAGLAGRRVVELGPGNHLGVALALVSLGVGQVICVDRFRPKQNLAQTRALYALLRRQMTPEQSSRCTGLLEDSEAAPNGLDSPLCYLPNCGVEELGVRLQGHPVDLIISRSVLEHVRDLDRAFAGMAAVLRPGGTMLHKIDLRSHEEGDEDYPLEFLTHSPSWWHWMTSQTGEPNRQRQSSYVASAERHGFQLGLLEVTHQLSRDKVAALRPRLARPFREMSDEELQVTGIWLRASKV